MRNIAEKSGRDNMGKYCYLLFLKDEVTCYPHLYAWTTSKKDRDLFLSIRNTQRFLVKKEKSKDVLDILEHRYSSEQIVYDYVHTGEIDIKVYLTIYEADRFNNGLESIIDSQAYTLRELKSYLNEKLVKKLDMVEPKNYLITDTNGSTSRYYELNELDFLFNEIIQDTL